jgi:hypothetical protein
VTNVRGAAAVLQHYHRYYRRAIKDAFNRSSRKPFQCGGLRGYDQLVGIERRSAASQADQVRQTHAFLVRVERYLAKAHRSGARTDTAETNTPKSDSKTVRQELDKMFSDLVQPPKACPLARRLARRWRAMRTSWLPHTECALL